MSLPLHWVDRIFDKLTLTYGQAFLARWRDIDLNAVKSDWMHELSVFQQAPQRISYALENLPIRPPSVIEFKELCRQAPATQAVSIPESQAKADPARVAAELQKLVPLLSNQPKVDHKEWARVIVENPKGRTPTVLKMARDALVSA